MAISSIRCGSSSPARGNSTAACSPISSVSATASTACSSKLPTCPGSRRGSHDARGSRRQNDDVGVPDPPYNKIVGGTCEVILKLVVPEFERRAFNLQAGLTDAHLIGKSRRG